MINHVIAINKKGISHEQCEDSVYIDNHNAIYIVCDGVSNSLYGGLGAKELSENIGKSLAIPKAKKYLAQKNPDDIRKMLCELIRRVTESTMEKLSCSADDIASTLIVVSIYDDTITVIHAGDGAVFAAPEVYQNEVPMIVSYPDNDAEQRVFPAASPRQIERMRVIRLKARDIKCLAFGTDGFTGRYIRPETMGFDGYSLNEVFKVNNEEELNSLIENNHLSRPAITDDISAVIIKFDNAIEYTGNSIAGHIENHKEETQSPAIKSADTDGEFLGKNKKSESNQEEQSKTTPNNTVVATSVKIIFSVLLVCCAIAVCILGYYTEAANKEYDKEVAALSEEVSNLQNRVEILENTEEENEVVSNDTYDETDSDTVNDENSMDGALREGETIKGETSSNENIIGEETPNDEEAVTQSPINGNYTRY